MNLCHYIGKPLTADIRTADTFPEVAQDIRLQTADISARPEYAILNQQVAIAKQQVKLNRSELLPKIGSERSCTTTSTAWKSATRTCSTAAASLCF